MIYTELGATGIKVSRIGMGCMTIVDTVFSGDHDEATGVRTLHAAHDAGINFFDTAEMYGDGASEALLGKAFKGRWDKIVIASKVGPSNLTRDGVVRACERSLRHLGTDRIDLYQIHWANPAVPLAETCQGLEELKAQGKIRAVGVCNFGVADMTAMADIMPIVTNQLPYSLLWRAIEFEIIPLLLRRKTGILAYSPILHGLLAGKYGNADVVPEGIARTRHFAKSRPKARHGEDGCEAETFAAIAAIGKISARAGLPMAQVALAWVLAQKGGTSFLAGVTKPEQIASNVRAVDAMLPDDVVTELTRVTETVKAKLGRNVDMWDSKSRIK